MTKPTRLQFIGLIPAAILLFAGAMKIVEVISNGIYVLSYFDIGYEVVVSLIEICIGLTLASRGIATGPRVCALSLFFVFAAASGIKIFNGSQNCGCFGRLETSPHFSFSICVIASMILIVAPRSQFTVSKTKGFSEFFTLVAFSLILGLFVSTMEDRKTLDDDIRGSDTVLLNISSWIGKTLPLTKHLPGAEPLLQGEWELLFFNENCNKCRQTLAELTTSRSNIAIIQIPPYSEPQRFDTRSNDGQWLWLRLPPGNDWIVENGARIRLLDGIVMQKY